MFTESSFDTQAANDKKQRYHKSESETWSAAAVTNTPRDHTDESYEHKPMTGVSDIEAQYDQHAKYLLGHRIVLAHILAEVIEDFHGMHPGEIMPYIDREIHIGTVPAEPGQTNTATDTAGARIVGLNTENGELCEGKIFFDVLFYLDLPARRGLHRLLRVLFSPVLTKTQKFKILWEEYGIGQDFYNTDMIDTFRKEVDAMCNLSQGVKEYGIKIGREEGYIAGKDAGSKETLVNIILRSFQQGFTVENISSITDMSIEKIKEIIWKEMHVKV